MASSINDNPPFSIFDKKRRQWNSDSILEWLLDRNKNDEDKSKLLAICDFEAYSNGLNFVFGQAHINGKVSAIYLPRLRQEFYGLNPDKSLFY